MTNKSVATFALNLFKQRLIESGLVREIREPYSIESAQVRAPIQVEGKPLSEMIIAEPR
jgi:hypothetical protein